MKISMFFVKISLMFALIGELCGVCCEYLEEIDCVLMAPHCILMVD